MKALAREMRQSIGDHPAMESLVMTLVDQLETVKGEKNTAISPIG